jgi:exodeoxyribonuclease V alpha subunit
MSRPVASPPVPDEELVGEVLGVLHADPSTGFGVIELDPGDGAPGERCSGPLADLVEGQTVRLVGRRRDHPRYGPTFEAILYEQVTPATVAGMVAFLGSDRFAAVPEAARTRVLRVFGAAAGDVIERQPERLESEAGLDPEVARALVGAWLAGQAMARLVALVADAGWPMDAVRSAHARFGADVVAVAREDPYGLLEAERVRFAHADGLARTLGIARDDPRRLTAGAWAAVRSARGTQGHQHLPVDEAVEAAARSLGVDRVLARAGLEVAVDSGRLARQVVADADVVSTPDALATEQRLAEGLQRLVRATSRLAVGSRSGGADAGTGGGDGRAAGEADAGDEELTAGQRSAVDTASAHTVTVLTGGPGTGKTRTVQEVVRRARAVGANVALAAPTGRAAKRLEELVGVPATTVHRLLEARPDGAGGFAFRHGPADPLPHDLVVVDEVSMCDTWLAERLVAAIEDGTHLLLVGDPDQLPSVGPGDVLRDLIASGAVPVVHLDEIHRQAAGSRIVRLAREVLEGEVGPLSGRDGDVFLAEEPDRAMVVARVVRAVAERAPREFGVAVEDVQVLAPLYRGPTGVDALNAALKEALNPAAGRVAVGGFHVGDRVMQTRNDAELDVANGDVGTVVDTARREGTVRVAFPRGEVSYPASKVRDLVPAWAVTVHKAQGGEWPVVVLVCDPSHRTMLWRNLVYTAITRARQALVLVGRAEALRTAARSVRSNERHTGLAWRLTIEGQRG